VTTSVSSAQYLPPPPLQLKSSSQMAVFFSYVRIRRTVERRLSSLTLSNTTFWPGGH